MSTNYQLCNQYLIESHDAFLLLNSSFPYTHPSPLIPTPLPLYPLSLPLYPLPSPYTCSPSPPLIPLIPLPLYPSPSPYMHPTPLIPVPLLLYLLPSPYTCSPSLIPAPPPLIPASPPLISALPPFIPAPPPLIPLIYYPIVSLTLEEQMWYKDITHHKPHDTSCNTLKFIHASMYPPPR